MKQARLSPAKYLSGSGILAGIFVGSSAHGAIVTQYPDAAVTGANSEFFDIDANPAFNSGATEFSVTTTNDMFQAPKLSANNPNTGVASVSPGDTISSSTVFTTPTFDPFGSDANIDFQNGQNYIGLEIQETGNTDYNYGYAVVTQTGDSTDGFTDDVTELVYDTAAGDSLYVTPEPSATSLLLAGAAGAAGLLLYRRRRDSLVHPVS